MNLCGGPGRYMHIDPVLRRRVPRERVFLAIDSERSYQDNLKKDRAENPTDGTRSINHSVGDFVTMMQHYQNELTAAWTKNPGDTAALHVMRKMAGIAVNCMEQHGAPLRKPDAAATPAARHGSFTGWLDEEVESDKDEDALEDERDWTSFFKPGGTA